MDWCEIVLCLGRAQDNALGALHSAAGEAPGFEAVRAMALEMGAAVSSGRLRRPQGPASLVALLRA